jgi:ribosomal protein S18 acetylase RimI-like enzyme
MPMQGSVHVATADERDALVDTLVLAFVRDPVARFVFSAPSAYRGGFAAFVRSFAGAALAGGTVFAAPAFRGAALWMAPGMASDDTELMAGFAGWVAPEKLETAGALMQEMMERHPEEPHWYLPLIGVDPALQGHGIGTELLRHSLARVDRDRLPAYLESTNPANVPLYERHGFEVLEAIEVGDVPRIVPMLRPARG